MIIPERVRNWISGEERDPHGSSWMEKLAPATGSVLSRVARSGAADVAQAVEAAEASQPGWAAVPPVRRGLMLHDLVRIMQARRDDLAEVVACETGKSRKDAAGEVGGAIQLGLFFASEGQRLYGRTTTSGTAFRQAPEIVRLRTNPEALRNGQSSVPGASSTSRTFLLRRCRSASSNLSRSSK